MNLYSWQISAWRQLWQSGIDRLPHALLICGSPGIGKRSFANVFAKSLVCQRLSASNLPCGACDSCRFFEQNSHPDIRHVMPEAEVELDEADAKEKKPSEFITINQIRALGNFVSLTSHQNGRRVALISSAELLNINAANALLKMLEEPPQNTLFVLVTNNLSRILPTIRSRCRLLKLPIPDPREAGLWLAEQRCADSALNLALAGQAPLDALDISANADWQSQRKGFCDALASVPGDPIAVAELVQKIDAAVVLRWLQTWIYDLISLKTIQSHRYHTDQSNSLNKINKQFQLFDLLNFNDEIIASKRLIRHPLNIKLVWESLFIKYFNFMN